MKICKLLETFENYKSNDFVGRFNSVIPSVTHNNSCEPADIVLKSGSENINALKKYANNFMVTDNFSDFNDSL